MSKSLFEHRHLPAIKALDERIIYYTASFETVNKYSIINKTVKQIYKNEIASLKRSVKYLKKDKRKER